MKSVNEVYMTKRNAEEYNAKNCLTIFFYAVLPFPEYNLI